MVVGMVRWSLVTTMMIMFVMQFGLVANMRMRNPFDKPDSQYSPQIPLGTMLGEKKSSFIESIPSGEIIFGDAVVSKSQKDRLFNPLIGDAAINDKSLRWTDAVIPYVIDCSIENLKDAVYAVKLAMKEWEDKTCIRFVPRTNEKNFLRFFRHTHCWGNVGMLNYSSISVGNGCEFPHVMAHEIGHAVGFYHEQNRKDRDYWVRINWNNIGKFKYAFDKVKNTYSLGVPYDYASIMHYPWTAFSSNGRETMTPLRSRGGKLPYVSISDADAEQTSKMYNCPDIERKRRNARLSIKNLLANELRVGNIVAVPENPMIGEMALIQKMMSEVGTAGCVDWSQNCAGWFEAGYCPIYPIVRQYCKKTCNEPVCKSVCSIKDRYDQCSQWAGTGFCTNPTYEAYMKEHCCNACQDKLTPDCVDKNRNCKAWAKGGYCASSKTWMSKNCCKSCKGVVVPTTAATLPPTTTTTTAKPTTLPPKCVDSRNDCKDRKRRGYCGNKMIAVACCKTCNEQTCVDKKSSCASWAKSGYCTNRDYVDYMENNCCKSCQEGEKPTTKLPTKPTTTAAPTTTAKPTPVKRKFLGTGKLCQQVRDMKAKCPSWARSGECTKNPEYMNANCQKSCKYCDNLGLKPDGICTEPLGLSFDGTNNFKIPDSAFSSARGSLRAGDWTAGPENARLYYTDDYQRKRMGAWCSPTSDVKLDTLQSITVDLGRQKRITHIATQGRDRYFERVSEFKIEYSKTGYTDDFYPYKENGTEKIFTGNCDHQTPVLNTFLDVLEARFVKFIPWKFNYPCVRMEFYGCNIDDMQPAPIKERPLGFEP